MASIEKTLREIAPKLFRGLPKDAWLENSAVMSDRIVLYWRLPDGRPVQRSMLIKDLPKGKVTIK